MRRALLWSRWHRVGLVLGGLALAGLALGIAASSCGYERAASTGACSHHAELALREVCHRDWNAPAGLGPDVQLVALHDVNGDAWEDFAVGLPGYCGPEAKAGRVDLLSGADGAVIRTHVEMELAASFGRGIAALSDRDGDGVAEYAIGAPGGRASSGEPAAEAWVKVFSGQTGAPLETIVGPAIEGFGTALVALADVDGDGREELAIGAPNFGAVSVSSSVGVGTVTHYTPGRGRVFAHLSASGRQEVIAEGVARESLGLSLCSLPASQPRGLATLVCAGTSGITGVEIGSARSAWTGVEEESIPTLGQPPGAGVDLDGDGVPDFVASCDRHWFVESTSKTAAYSGCDGERIRSYGGEHDGAAAVIAARTAAQRPAIAITTRAGLDVVCADDGQLLAQVAFDEQRNLTVRSICLVRPLRPDREVRIAVSGYQMDPGGVLTKTVWVFELRTE